MLVPFQLCVESGLPEFAKELEQSFWLCLRWKGHPRRQTLLAAPSLLALGALSLPKPLMRIRSPKESPRFPKRYDVQTSVS